MVTCLCSPVISAILLTTFNLQKYRLWLAQIMYQCRLPISALQLFEKYEIYDLYIYTGKAIRK